MGRSDRCNGKATPTTTRLQLNLTQRLAHGFQLRVSYTWGKSLDTGSSTIVGDEFLNSMSSLVSFNLRLNPGLSDFNVAQALVVAGTWQVPGCVPDPDRWPWPRRDGR
jgi:hypothetical protein